MTPEHLLVFELSEGGDQLEVHANEEGIRLLRKQLDFLLGGETHIHLKTPSWAGTELSETPQGKNSSVLHHVKIFKWNPKRT